MLWQHALYWRTISMKKKRKNSLIFSLTLFIMLLSVALMTLPFIRKAPANEIVFTVHAGESIRSIADRLADEGVIEEAELFVMMSKMFKVDRKIKSGDYLLEEDSYEYSTLMKMYRGEVVLVRLTIPEGFNMYQIAGRINAVTGADSASFINVCRNRILLKEFGIHAASAEGYLYPDTYILSKGKSPQEIIRIMLSRFNALLPDTLFAGRYNDMTKHQYIILASMVEKEAVVSGEKKRIAGVYYNRLKKNMHLQCCATVLYALGKSSGIPTYEETQYDSPYNTYQNPGLPPGPICSPSIETVNAVLNPEQNDFLFYVSKGDGTHIFTKSYKEHLRVQQNLR